MSASSLAPLWVVGAFVSVAAAFDVGRFRIPNALTIPALGLGLIYHLLAGGWDGWVASAAGAACGAGCLLGLYCVGALGAGDVKLLAAVGAWLGGPATLYVFLVAALAAGLCSAALLLGQGRLGCTLRSLPLHLLQVLSCGAYRPLAVRVEAALGGPQRRRRCLPFGAMIAVGVLTLGCHVYCTLA